LGAPECELRGFTAAVATILAAHLSPPPHCHTLSSLKLREKSKTSENGRELSSLLCVRTHMGIGKCPGQCFSWDEAGRNISLLFLLQSIFSVCFSQSR